MSDEALADPTMHKVQSSNLEEVGHHDGHLYVRFKDRLGRRGALWRYACDEAILDEMLTTESVGKFFAARVRNDMRGERVHD